MHRKSIWIISHLIIFLFFNLSLQIKDMQVLIY